MKKTLTALLVLATTQVTMAAFTPTTTIKSINVYDDYIVVKTANKHKNYHNCTKDVATSYLYMSTKGDGGKAKYSAVLSAQVAGKKIRLGYVGCASWGNGTIPKVYGVSLSQ